MLTATTSHSARARVMRETWPACRAPMVGTRPTVRPVARARCSSSWQPVAVVTTRMAYTATGAVGRAGSLRRIGSVDRAGPVDRAGSVDGFAAASRAARAAPAW